MNSKKAVRLLLFIFVAASVVMMIIKMSQRDNGSFADSGEILPENVDIVYYFYTNDRCETCEKIERLTSETVKSGFENELSSGSLIWKTVNTDDEGNHHFLEDYDLYTKSVILARFRNGKQTTWKNLEDIWALTEDETSFKTYITDEIKKFLESN
ncbi:nitrophenyl compound nitroreductase subunit ArsF family protein [candidate division KSB1 bacterium]